MTDAYWDELGIAWRADIPDMDVLTTRLRTRLRRQTFNMRAKFVLDIVGVILATAIGAFWAWKGIWGGGTWRNTATGFLIIVVAAIAMALSLWLRRGERGDTENLSNMIDLAISRAERAFRRVRSMYIASTMVAFFYVAMWFIHPAYDRFPIDVVHRRLLFATAFVIVFMSGWITWAIYRRRRAQIDLDKFRYLKSLLEAE